MMMCGRLECQPLMLLEVLKEVEPNGRKLGHWGVLLECTLRPIPFLSFSPSWTLEGEQLCTSWAPRDVLPHHRPKVTGLSKYELIPYS
jgi:hypothetical protein